MRISSLLFGLFLIANAYADLGADDANSAFAPGLRAYAAGDYEQAVRVFEQVFKLEPDCARCANLLGRSYGRLAEKASWLSAVSLARKTRGALEQAVALDPTDVRAIEDLIKYYRAAPGFLGGSAEKARALEQRLQRFDSDHTS